MVYEDLNVTPTVEVFFYFYTTKMEKGRCVLGDDNTLLFLLYWMNYLVEITRYNQAFFNLEEKRIVCLLWKFKIMDFHEVIRVWLGRGNPLAAYLGKFYFVSLCRYF